MQIDVSIIVVSWNTCAILCDCLLSIQRQTSGISYELIVVDNASSDGSVRAVREQFPDVQLIENTENLGFAAANNQAIAVACGRYLLLLNSDTLILDGAIQKTIAFADAHTEAGMVGCRVLNSDRSLQPTCFMYPSILNLLLNTFYLNKMFPRSRFFGRERMTWWDRSDEREVEVVTGCFMLIRREAVEQVGMMDESFFMYGEETDWCYRFNDADWKILFTPSAEIVHLGGQSSKLVRPQMVLQLRAGILQFFHKHHSRAAYAAACILIAVWFGIRILPWTVLGLIFGRARTRAFTMARTYAAGMNKSVRGWRALTRRGVHLVNEE